MNFVKIVFICTPHRHIVHLLRQIFSEKDIQYNVDNIFVQIYNKRSKSGYSYYEHAMLTFLIAEIGETFQCAGL